jgi:hypothetical protein
VLDKSLKSVSERLFGSGIKISQESASRDDSEHILLPGLHALPVFALGLAGGCPQGRTAPLTPWPRGTCRGEGEAILLVSETPVSKNDGIYGADKKEVYRHFDAIAIAAIDYLNRYIVDWD